VLTLRWKLEKRRWFSQGYWAHSLRRQIVEGEDTEHTIYASVLDNNHISVRLGPLEVGGFMGAHQISGKERMEGRS
jgi:hypothetical protein